MTSTGQHTDKLQIENKLFYEKAEGALRELFEIAKSKNELYFAMALNPEFRGLQDAGWNTAADAHVAFGEYLQFLNDGPASTLKSRVALAFYCHLAEASGFYEIPKNMLRIAGANHITLGPSRIWLKNIKQLAR